MQCSLGRFDSVSENAGLCDLLCPMLVRHSNSCVEDRGAENGACDAVIHPPTVSLGPITVWCPQVVVAGCKVHHQGGRRELGRPDGAPCSVGRSFSLLMAQTLRLGLCF